MYLFIHSFCIYLFIFYLCMTVEGLNGYICVPHFHFIFKDIVNIEHKSKISVLGLISYNKRSYCSKLTSYIFLL